MNLYEINDQIMEAFERSVDPDTGEIVNAEAYAALDALQMSFDQKAEAVLLLIKNLSADSEAYKREKLAFEARQKAAENRTESLKRYISTALNGAKFSTDRVAVTWRKSEAVEYTGDLQTLPPEFLRIKEPEINRTELKRVLKTGAVIPGASLVIKQNIQIK